ncbi:MAG: hypothetical protein RIR95_211 [Pseudomonadota bacterium]
MTIAPIAQVDSFTAAQGANSTTITGNLGANNGNGVDYDPDGSTLGWVAGAVTSLAGDGDRFLSAFFSGGVLSFLTIQGTVSYPHPVIVTSTAIRTAEGGQVFLDTSGNFHYTSALGFSGADSFTYTLVDADFNFTTSTVSLTVAPTAGANDRPIAADDAFTLAEDTVLFGNLLANNGFGTDSDPDGDALTVVNNTIFSTMGGLVRIFVDGSFTYTPRAGFSGVDGFDYTLLDPSGAKDMGHVTLTVQSMNDAPEAFDDSFTAVHDRSLTGNVLANNGSGPDRDQDGDLLTVAAGPIVTAAGGLVTLNADGSFTYQPKSGFTGPDGFDYTVRDPSGASDIGHVTLNVINRAPVAQLDAFSMGYRATVTGNVMANNGSGPDSDPDGDAISVVAGRSVSTKGSILTLASDGSFSFKAGDLSYGLEVMTYTLTDTLGATRSGSMQFWVGGHGGFQGGPLDDIWAGSASNDIAMLSSGDDTADGGGGADIIGGGAGDDSILGGLGNDRLYGEDGKDELSGGGGADRLNGGAGRDLLRGGAGADRFVLNSFSYDADRIADFTAADRLEIVAADLGLSAGPLADATWLVAHGGADGSHGRFEYHAASKSLYWDADGLSATADLLVATFDTKVSLTIDSVVLV